MVSRNAVKDRIRQCLGIAKRNSLPLCLALMAIDGLDLRLQQQGKEKTEQVLIELIEEIQYNLRESDWVAYWGNNQFVMVIFAPPKGAQIALERIFEAFKNRELTGHQNTIIPCQGKIGFTQVQPNEHMNACLDRIEQALHRSRKSERALVFLR
ncbi:MAG: GGDEF domain-containing protein [Limnospira sp.]